MDISYDLLAANDSQINVSNGGQMPQSHALPPLYTTLSLRREVALLEYLISLDCTPVTNVWIWQDDNDFTVAIRENIDHLLQELGDNLHHQWRDFTVAYLDKLVHNIIVTG